MNRTLQYARKTVVICVAFWIVVCALGLSPVGAHPEGSTPLPTHEYDGYGVEPIDANEGILPATDLSLSLLSFAVGVAACLLVVRALLPTLVQAHCAEIVRDYLDRTARDSEVKVLVIDRDSEPRAPTVRSPELQTTSASRSVRVDEALSASTRPKRATTASGEEMQSLLGNIYEQNVDLQSKLRSQRKTTQP